MKKADNKKEETTVFVGKVRDIRFYAPDTSWGVITVACRDEVPHSKPSVEYDVETNLETEVFVVTVVGKMPEPIEGDVYSIEGRAISSKYGKQYEIASINALQPKTVDEQKAYLSALLTSKQVDALIATYPNIVEDVMNGTDDVDLSLLHGIGESTWAKIKEKIISNFAISDILSLLIPIGVSFNKIQKLLDDEPNPQILREKIIHNPYVITSIDGITFRTADKIAIQLNPKLKQSEKRLMAFIRHYLNDVANDGGHTHVNIEELRAAVIENVAEVEKFFNGYVTKEKFFDDHETKERVKSRILHWEGDRVGLRFFYESEKFIFDTLVALDRSVPLEIDDAFIEEGIALAESDLGIKFTQEQRDIVFSVTKSNFSILTGRAGTGKSTLSRAILNAYKLAGYGENDGIAIAALSAKAAVRAKEATGYDATTIHRLLEAKGDNRFNFSEINKLQKRVILLDECSMINASLFRAFLKAVDITETKVIWVGDVGQLPPIGAGNIFSDLFANGYPFNQYELTKIQRQAEKSAIIVDGNKIREGVNPIERSEQDTSRIVHGELRDLHYRFLDDKESLFQQAVEAFKRSVAQKGIENVFILTPRKQGTLNCTFELNKRIQSEINAENEDNKFVHGTREFRLGDKVIHTVNDYDKNVFNGEVGFVTAVDKKQISVDYGDKTVNYKHDDINDLELAYALTIHKMQGSQNKDIIVILDNTHFVLLSSQLLYTAITRAQERGMVLAQPFAFKKCLEEDKTVRNTWLRSFVADEPTNT